MSVAIGSTLGHFEITARIGAGGMGEVYRAADTKLGREVAFKVLPAAMASDPERLSRFQREAKTVAALNHPNIVTIHSVEEADGIHFLTMELVAGKALDELLPAGGFSLERLLELAIPIADAVASAHSRGIIHRDLKPANVMVTDEGSRVKVLDFGLAKMSQPIRDGDATETAPLTRDGRVMGTTPYMSPEQVRGSAVDARSDIFSLGIMLYEMAAGRRPFAGESFAEVIAAIQRDDAEALTVVRSDLPRHLGRIVQHCLEKDPDRRYQSALDVRNELEQLRREVGEATLVSGAAAGGVTPVESGRALKTLLVTDLVASSRMLETLGDRRTAEVMASHDRLARDLLAEHDGLEIDKTHGFLLLFERPLAAVGYALAYHRGLAALAREEGVELAARAGIHLGEVFLRPNPPEDVARGAKPLEVEGLAKPTAARLMSLAGARQTLLTRGAFDVARRGAVGEESQGESLRWLAHGEYLFEGSEDPVGVFEVGVEGFSPLAPPADSARARHTEGRDAILGWRPAAGQEIATRPHWELSEKLGEGGFGEVWLARHRKTGERRVFKFCFDAERLRALQREITLFRLLKEELGERDDIARILDWSFDEVPYFIESEYTAGGSLIDWAGAAGGIAEVPLAERLEIVAQVAEALAAAHSVGVLHKDVKPGNVLIHTEAKGRLQARLADFGIGGVTDEERLASAGITVLGMTRMAPETSERSTLGTQLYHAPELLEGKAATVQADVYALGVMLYQLVVGDLHRALGPGWERGVEDELLREDIALSVDVSPRRRLGNALRLAERLRSLAARRAEHESERRAREEVERTRAALVRSRRQRRLAAAVLTLLLVFGAAVTTLWRRSEEARRQTEKALLRAEASKLVALGRVEMERAPTFAVAYALASLELADVPEARILALEALWRGPTAIVLQSGEWSEAVDFSPDGRWLAEERSGFTALWAREGGDPRFLEHGRGPVRFGPEDLLITSSLADGLIRFWSLPDLEPRRSLEVENLLSWEITADRTRLLTVVESAGTWLAQSRPLTGGEPKLLGRSPRVSSPAPRSAGGRPASPRIDPTGSWLAFSASPKQVTIRGVDGSGATVRAWHEDSIMAHLFSADGRRFATGDRSGEIRVWSLSPPEPAPRVLKGHRGRIGGLAFDRQGQRLASAGWDGTARIWDLDGPPEADALVTRAPFQMNGVAFHASGRWLASASSAGPAISPLGRPYARVLRGHGGTTYGTAFSPDGSWVASSSNDGTIRQWPLQAQAGQASSVLLRKPGSGVPLDLDIDPDGRYLLAGWGTTPTLIPLGGGALRELEGFDSQAGYVALDTGGRLAAAAAGQFDPRDGVIRIWDLETGDVRILDPGESPGGGRWIAFLQFTPEGRLVSGGHGGVRTWNVDDGSFETLREGTEGEESLFSLALSPDGRLLASSRNGGELWVQDLPSGDPREISSHGGGLHPLVLDATGTALVTADFAGRVRFGPITGEEPHLLLGHQGPVFDLAVSPDGRWIASVGRDATLRLWPRPEGQPFHTLPYEELLDRLRALTNFRVVRDEEAEGGYRYELADFPGWETVPTW